MKIIDHPHRGAPHKHVKFKDGRVFSCVNLAGPFRRKGGDSYALPNIGEVYDSMGGRFEAMCLATEEQFRAHSMEALIEILKDYVQTPESKTEEAPQMSR